MRVPVFRRWTKKGKKKGKKKKKGEGRKGEGKSSQRRVNALSHGVALRGKEKGEKRKKEGREGKKASSYLKTKNDRH